MDINYRQDVMGLSGAETQTELDKKLEYSCNNLENSNLAFLRGDLMLKYNYTLDEFAKKWGLAKQTVKGLKTVCNRIPRELRRPELFYTHHQVVAMLDRESVKIWLQRAIDENWSVGQLRREVDKWRQEQKGKGKPISLTGQLSNATRGHGSRGGRAGIISPEAANRGEQCLVLDAESSAQLIEVCRRKGSEDDPTVVLKEMVARYLREN